VNACYEESRRHRRWISRIRALPVDGPSSPDPTLSVDDRDTLDRAFLRLTPQHRAVSTKPLPRLAESDETDMYAAR
jgi:DNA-directed RNA polymerase specialized sigma24 family protein